jgi:sec-independent protein translocase protein TatA
LQGRVRFAEVLQTLILRVKIPRLLTLCNPKKKHLLLVVKMGYGSTDKLIAFLWLQHEVFMSGSHILILAVVVIIFVLGPAKLPQLGRGLGDAIRGFKKGMAGEDDNEIDVTETSNEKLHHSGKEDVTRQKQTKKEKV